MSPPPLPRPGPGPPAARALLAVVLAALAGACVDGRGLLSVGVEMPDGPVAAGATAQLVATGRNWDGTTLDLTPSAGWTSSDESVATVEAGLATAHAEGTTLVTATDPATGRSGSAELRVGPPLLLSVALTPPEPRIAAGTAVQLTATGTFGDGTTADLTDVLDWTSSDLSVAAVEGGLAVGSEPGEAQLRAEDPESGAAGATTLTVTSAELVSLAVTPTAPTLALGTTTELTATGTYTDATTQDLTDAVTWSVSPPTVVAVGSGAGSGGVLTATATGTASVVATHVASGHSGSTAVTVTPAALVSLAVTPTTPSIALGTSQSFSATGTFTDRTVQDLTASVDWSSSDPTVASVGDVPGSKGLATSAAVGIADVRAADPATGLAGTTRLTVTAAELVSLAVTPAGPSIALGTAQAFAAAGTFTDGSLQDLTDSVTWSSSDPGVATVSNASGTEGLATSAAVGDTDVTATHPGSGVDDTTSMTVTPAELVSLAVTPADPSIALGTSQALAATGTFTDGSMQDLTDSVTWSSSAPGVATVSNAGGTEGLATSVAVGDTDVSAVHPGSGIDDTTTLTVTPAELVSLEVAPDGLSVPAGLTRQLGATGTYTDGSLQDRTDSVTWSSSDDDVATVSNAGGSEGLVTAVAPGSVSVTATDVASGVDGTAALAVVPEITLRSVTTASATGAGDVALATPAGTAAGDALIASIAFRPDTATVTPPAGWTLVRRLDNAAGNSNSLAVYLRLAGDSEPADQAWNVTPSTGVAAGMAAFYGADPTDALDVEDGQSTGSGLSHTAPGVTATTTRTVLVASHAFSSSSAWTAPAALTEALEVASLPLGDAAGISLVVSWAVQPTAGATGPQTATANANADTGNAHLLALSP